MKPIVVFAITFAVAAAGSTGASVMMHKPPPAKPVMADSTAHGDSARADTAVVASGQAPTPPADTTPVPAAAAASQAKDSARSATSTSAVVQPVPNIALPKP